MCKDGTLHDRWGLDAPPPQELADLEQEMHYLDRMPPPKDYILHVVSMDIVVDSVWGDDMVPGTRD